MLSRRVLAAALLAATLATASPARADEGFTADLPFADVATADSLAVLSGALTATAEADGAPAVLHNTTGFTLDGLTLACWTYPCHRPEGALAVRVAAGSTVALRLPDGGTVEVTAPAAVASPIWFDARKAGFGGMDASLAVVPSLVVAAPGGTLSLGAATLGRSPDGPVPARAPVGGLPPQLAQQFQAPDPGQGRAALLATLTGSSRLEVLDSGAVVHTVRGAGGLLLQGRIAAPPLAAEVFVVPCSLGCAVAVTSDGATGDVLASVRTLLEAAQAVGGDPVPPLEFGLLGSLLDPVARGVYLDLPLVARPEDFRFAEMTIARFDRLETTLAPGAPAAEGSGSLVIQSGSVAGAPTFVGARYVGMPVACYVLWASALVALVTRASLRRGEPKTTGPRWVPLALTTVGTVALAFLWHLEFAKVLGLNATTPGLAGDARWLVAGVELATLAALAILVVLPARILAANTLRLAGLPRAARFAGSLAVAAGILAGPPLLLGLIDFALRFAP